jgi:TolB-like protein
MNPTRRRLLTAGALLAATAGCSTIDVAPRADLDRSARWAVLPLANQTETPGAGQRAAAVIEGVLHTRGITQLARPPATLGAESLFEPADAASADKALAWARSADVRYAVTGTVTEWRYKVGVDGEPAVGLSLQVIDLGSGRTVWAATGGRSGWSREALSAVAQKLVRDLTAPLAR